MPDKIFIDSNIFLYAFCNKDKKKQVLAKNIITNDASISVQVINEVSVKKITINGKANTKFHYKLLF